MALQYDFTEEDALPYVANMYSGKSESNYIALIDKSDLPGVLLAVNDIMRHMESIYITPHTTRQAGDNLSKLAIGQNGPLAKAITELEDKLYKLPDSSDEEDKLESAKLRTLSKGLARSYVMD